MLFKCKAEISASITIISALSNVWVGTHNATWRSLRVDVRGRCCFCSILLMLKQTAFYWWKPKFFCSICCWFFSSIQSNKHRAEQRAVKYILGSPTSRKPSAVYPITHVIDLEWIPMSPESNVGRSVICSIAATRSDISKCKNHQKPEFRRPSCRVAASQVSMNLVHR